MPSVNRLPFFLVFGWAISLWPVASLAHTASVEIFSDYINWEEMAKARTSITYNSYNVVDRGMASGTLRISGSGTSDDISFSFDTIVDMGPQKYDGNGDGVFDILDPASSYNQTFTGTEKGTYVGHGSVDFTVRYEAQRSVNQRSLNVGGSGTVTSSSVPNLSVGHQFSATPLFLEPFGASGTLDFDTSSKSYSADLSRFGESGKVGKTSTFVINDADSLLLQGFPIPNPGGATTYADVTLARKGNLYHKQIKVGDVSYYVRVTDPNDSDSDSIPDLSDKPDRLLWEFDTNESLSDAPAIGLYGTVYIGTGTWSSSLKMTNKIYALDGKSGAKKWEFDTGDMVWSSPAVGADGTVYVCSSENEIYALDGQTGAKKWEFDTGGYIYASPVVGSNGIIYICAWRGGGRIFALNSHSGAKLWEFNTTSDVTATPAIGSDGTVYVGSFSKFYALNGQTGDKLWEFDAGLEHSSPVIGWNDTIYFGSTDGKVYALNGNIGTKRWEFQTGNIDVPGHVYPFSSSPTLGANGMLYVGSSDQKVYALDGQTGYKLWEFETGNVVYSSPAVGSDGTVYVGSSNAQGKGKMLALSGTTGAELWKFETAGGVGSSPAIDSDGTIYFGSYDKKVYAIKTDSKGPAQSPWPMFGQNAQRTGLSPYSSDSNNSETKPVETAKEVETDLGYAQELGHGWYRSSWLGDFWDGNASWVYHLQLGWLYHHKDQSSSSHWLYSPGLGWLWTKESIGRYLYSYSRRGWLALRGASGSPALYDFRLSLWKSRERDAWIGEVSEQLFLSGLFKDDVPRGDSSREVVVEAGTRLEGDPGPVLTGETVIFENDVTVTGTLTIR